jgi:hypothetical protein
LTTSGLTTWRSWAAGEGRCDIALVTGRFRAIIFRMPGWHEANPWQAKAPQPTFETHFIIWGNELEGGGSNCDMWHQMMGITGRPVRISVQQEDRRE